MMTPKEKIKRLVAFIFGLIECLLLAGCIYGWAAIVFVFKEDGVFSHLCESSALGNSTNITLSVRIVTNLNSTPAPLPQHRYPMCQEQDNRLNLAFTIANFALEGSTLFVGWLFDSYGLRISRLLALSLFVTGSLMMGFASAEIPVLIFPGLICFGVGGIMFLVTNLQIGNYFDRFQLTVVTIFNSAFDTSSVTLLIFKVLYENGAQRLHLFIFLASFATVIVLTSTFVLIPKFKIKPRSQVREEKNVVLYKNKSEEVDVGSGKLDNALIEDKGKVVLEERKLVKPLRHYVFTRFYLIHLMWHAFIQLRFFVYIGSLNVWLQIVTQDDLTMVSALTNVFSIALMCGILAGPLEGFILMMETRRLKRDNMTYFDRIQPAAVPQMLCTIFCLILSILVLVPMVELLYVQFIMLTICRAFLYGLNCAYLVLAFPPEHFGKLFGILMTFNGVLGALQYPLFIWSSGPPRDPTTVNILMLVLTVITFLQPIQLWIGNKFQCCRKVPAEDVKLDNEIET
ncbi:equilibrative nucleobase transporter 1-like [Lineus longissimus]|uniref:equilibrative nucleobase transporter 1-like n=1 Tax=Lineus longissimus TaxID=88925 RepID=UPI002B4E215C